MDKLISADALKGGIEKVRDDDISPRWNHGLDTAIEIADELPAIDAIPVEWLRKYENEPIMKYSIQVILYLWQKEQEAR